MATITFRFGLDTIPPETKDKLIAPSISLLTAPLIPDLPSERKNLVTTFILNDLLWVLSNRDRQLIFNVIRKAEDALEEYCLATDSLKNHVSVPMWRTLNHYFDALRRFEHCLAHLYEAVGCVNRLNKRLSGPKQFDAGDGSILERVQIIHTAIKHMDQMFERGPFAEKTSFEYFATKADGSALAGNDDLRTAGNVPMWLTNEGLECASAKIAYTELAQEIREFSREAETFATMVPPKPRDWSQR